MVHRVWYTGGSIEELLTKHRVKHDTVHVHPVPHIALSSHARLVVCLRDPVSRSLPQDRPWCTPTPCTFHSL